MLNDWSDRDDDGRRPFFASWQFVSGFALVIIALTVVGIVMALL